MSLLRTIFAIAFPFLIACAPRGQENTIDMLFSDTSEGIKSAIASVYKMGKPAIPLLINRIENTRPVKIILASPLESYIEKADLVRPQGVLAAYLVEWVLAIDSMNLDEFMKSPFPFGDDSHNYIYPWGRLVIGGRMAVAEDLIAIKNIYQEWWRRNGSKELSELRIEWKHNIRPLSGTAFSWQ
jgi:hypothetical protein